MGQGVNVGGISVIAGLVPAIHDLLLHCKEDVDARVKPAHDE
ncbi:MAG: hypothetical protein QOH67_4185 [Hyphomicrobiales bacterium]|jgi:hypothetical protein|nr:hypothetical protein [Hyphomicrobiales bacterium]